MEKVYIITLMYCDEEIEFKATTSMEKAKQILKDWALQEEQSSWISEYDRDDFDYYDFDDDYFDVCYGDHRTTIFIKDVEVL